MDTHGVALARIKVLEKQIDELLNGIEFAINHDRERLHADRTNQNPHNCLGDVVDELLPLAQKHGRMNCEHVWRTDGMHSNEFCGKCFAPKPKDWYEISTRSNPLSSHGMWTGTCTRYGCLHWHPKCKASS